MGIVFLLGSGISIDAKMPSVDTITEQVISGQGVFLHTAGVFRIDASDPNYKNLRPPVDPVLELVRDLRHRAAEYFEREPNYEEISTLARQIDDALSGEYESAIVVPLLKQLMDRPYSKGNLDDLHDLSIQAHRYIEDTVRHMLDRMPSRLDHLGVIVKACEQNSHVNLATLNHDLVLETALEDADIDYADGFEQTDEDVRFWADDWDDVRVRLLKLHGSLDWWSYQIACEPWRGLVTARYQGNDPLHANRSGVGYPYDLRPILLTGTFIKILAYETWIFPDQHIRFHEALRETKRVVAIGYGFGDKAINMRLIGWLARARDNRLIVCHHDPDRLSKCARSAIQNNWIRWQEDEQLAIVPAYVAELDYKDIATHLS